MNTQLLEIVRDPHTGQDTLHLVSEDGRVVVWSAAEEAAAAAAAAAAAGTDLGI